MPANSKKGDRATDIQESKTRLGMTRGVKPSAQLGHWALGSASAKERGQSRRCAMSAHQPAWNSNPPPWASLHSLELPF